MANNLSRVENLEANEDVMEKVRETKDIILRHKWRSFSFKHLKNTCGYSSYETRDILIVLRHTGFITQIGNKSYKLNGGL